MERFKSIDNEALKEEARRPTPCRPHKPTTKTTKLAVLLKRSIKKLLLS
jgi:hypothetical protein